MKNVILSAKIRFEALIVRGLFGFFSLLPADTASNLGGGIFRLLGPLLPLTSIAKSNLQHALPTLSAKKHKQIIKGMWDNIGRTIGEFPHLATLEKNTISGPGWEIAGEKYLLEQARKGGKALFISGHIGNWEMLPPAVASYGLAFSSFYRAPNNPLVDRLIKNLRFKTLKADVPLFPKGAVGAKQGLRHLQQNGRLGLLIDQKMNDGIKALFFGQPAMTSSAAAVMALRFHCPIIPGYVQRIGPCRLRIVVEKPLTPDYILEKHFTEETLTQHLNDILEKWIREQPQSWLWVHKRWPITV